MIIDLQRRIQECGRIRIGHQVPAGKGTRPTKLDTFRLTSPDRNRITQASKLYGGTPQEWAAPSGKQWEVITTVDALPVIVPPGDIAFSQSYELWSAGGCQRRCDGVTESIGDGPCQCDPDARKCAIHTRLSVMLRDLSGLGVWRIDTQGYYAAVELQGAVEVVRLAAGAGRMLPATLRLEQRMVKRDGQTRRFAVPVLDIEVTPAQLLSGGAAVVEVAEIEAAPANNGAPLTPVPESVQEWPESSIAEQAMAAPQRRKGSQQPIPATGLKPRTAAQAAAETPQQPQRRNSVSDPNESFHAGVDEPHPEHPNQTCAEYEDAKLAEELAEENAADEHAESESEPESGEPITAQQLKLLAIKFRERGFTDQQRQDRLDFTASVIGRPIGSAKELTRAEASQVIDTLEN